MFPRPAKRRWASELSDVLLTGEVDDDDLAAIYTGAHALIFPSDDEGFGLPPVEALACGTPVAASDVPAVREVLGGRAILNRIGTDDISIANFCRESETARLLALVQRDPAEAVRALYAVPQNTEGDRARLQRRLFVDLVNLGHFAAAEDVLPAIEASISAHRVKMDFSI